MSIENEKNYHPAEPEKTNHHPNDKLPGERAKESVKESGQNVAGNRLDQPDALTAGPQGKRPTDEPGKPRQSREEKHKQ